MVHLLPKSIPGVIETPSCSSSWLQNASVIV
jgi:hypothetical protein